MKNGLFSGDIWMFEQNILFRLLIISTVNCLSIRYVHFFKIFVIINVKIQK